MLTTHDSICRNRFHGEELINSGADLGIVGESTDAISIVEGYIHQSKDSNIIAQRIGASESNGCMPGGERREFLIPLLFNADIDLRGKAPHKSIKGN